MNMLQLFKSKLVGDDSQSLGSIRPQDARSIAIVFNLVNHASVLAAVLFAKYFEERASDIKITMVDVRDVFPKGIDHYYWIECGTGDGFRDYFAKTGLMGLLKEDKDWLKTLPDCSTYLDSDIIQDRTVEQTVFGKMFNMLEALELIDDRDQTLIYRYGAMAEKWLTNDMDADTAAVYQCALKWCYHFYTGKDITLNDMIRLSLPTEEKTIAYVGDQRRINRTIGSRCRFTMVGSHTVQYITSTGPEVYGLVRRIALSNKEFVHVSEGSYGIVLFSSISIDEKVIDGNGILVLAPETVLA